MEIIGAILISTMLFLGLASYSCELDERDSKEMERLLTKLEDL